MNTSMTINATAAWLLGLYVANAERHGVAVEAAAGHDAERHRQGVPVPRHLHLPAAAVPPADRRHGRVLRRVDPEVEPDERLLVPPAGGGGDAGAGDRLQPGHRDRRARRGARVGPGARGPLPAGVRLDQLLRQRRHPLRRGDLQDAGLRRSCGSASAASATASPTTRRCASATACRSTASASPRRSPRTTCSASCSRCWASRCQPRRPRPVDPAAGVERGARPAPPVGPAVGAAHAAGAGLRDRPARVRRPLRRLARRRGAARPSWSTRRRPSSTTCSRSAARSRRSTS